MALTREQRIERAFHKARLRELEAPEKAERKARAKDSRREMKARVGKRAPGQRQERELDVGFLAFIRRLPCIAGVMLGAGNCEGAVQAAHIRFSEHGKGFNPGMGRKNHDRCTTPLCRHHHHDDQHKGNEQAFWNRLGVDAYDFAAALYAAYLAGADGLAVIRRFAPRRQGDHQ